MNEKGLDNWNEKQKYGQVIRDMLEGTDILSYLLWMRKCHFEIPNETLIGFVKEQVTETNYTKYHIDESVDSLSCRICSETGETISDIMS